MRSRNFNKNYTAGENDPVQLSVEKFLTFGVFSVTQEDGMTRLRI